MNDHVHVIVWPEEDRRLEDIVHSWKSFSAHELTKKYGRPAPIWQHESYDRLVRNKRELHRTISYILNNPKKRWSEMESYQWSWCKGMDQ